MKVYVAGAQGVHAGCTTIVQAVPLLSEGFK